MDKGLQSLEEIEAIEAEKSGLESLGKLTFLRSYSKNGEDYVGTVTRYLNFMAGHFPGLRSQIYGYGQAIIEKKMCPSMRALQYAGEPIDKANSRMFNCSFVGIQDFKDLADLCYLLACGCGVGLSVERKYVDNMPEIHDGYRYYAVPDSKEGWADSFLMLLLNPSIEFNYDMVRPAGAPLSSGGTASGSDPLKEAHEKIRVILKSRIGMRLRPIDVADIACLIAQAIVSGGSRRSALIVLFDANDAEMMNFKQGNWWDVNLHRAKANVSAVAIRGSKEAETAIKALVETAFGEPGIILSNLPTGEEDNTGGNPCLEISLRNYCFCNLTEIILPNVTSEDDFLFVCRAASFFGTLQATFTDFGYIKEEWKRHCEEDALIGVSVTGCAQMPKFVTSVLLEEGAQAIKMQNIATAKKVGINPAKRLTCVKPSGSTSCVYSTTSGIHAAHGEWVIRRIRVTKLSPLAQTLIRMFGISESESVVTEYGTFSLPVDKYSFIVNEAYSDKDIVLQFPCHYVGAVYRKNESAVSLLERAAFIYRHWVKPGHVVGSETNNVSLTVNFKPEEKQAVVEWMLSNQDKYRGISVLPEDCSAYPLLPFEEVTKEEWLKYFERFPSIDWQSLGVRSEAHSTVACSGGAGCEVT